MMNIFYKRLFNLDTGHDYFKDGFDRLVQLFPTAETKSLLRNGSRNGAITTATSRIIDTRKSKL